MLNGNLILTRLEAFNENISNKVLIDGEIKDCQRCHNARYKKMLNKK